jgi:adenine-specific DNA-methyltransferase
MSSPGEQTYQGRVELTWTNKAERLLVAEDGSYRWVPASDHRVAEVRLLESAATVGEVRPDGNRAADNLLIRGDALNALTSLTELSEFGAEYSKGVKLAYLDPPFNTQQSFLHYDDALEHSVWLTMMRDRLLQIKKLLAEDGSVWVHCDDYEQAHLRVLMDEVFGAGRFIATIVWQKRYSRENRAAIGSVHDYIIVFAPSGTDWREHRNRLERDERTERQYRNPDDDPLGPWRVIPLTAQGFRPNQMYPIVGPDGTEHYPPKGRCWGMIEEKVLEIKSNGRLYFGKDGKGTPGIIRYLSETEGLVPWSWWPSEEVGHNDESKKEMLELFSELQPFSTPKPERLMKRIVEIGSDPGDVVLDCFAGSGTTLAVAHKLGRRWIAVEREATTVENFTMPRLAKVVAGEDDGGITAAVGWRGGGGFRVLDVAPSMFVEDQGLVMLAEWATNGRLAEATAAQLGFEYRPDPPFCGVKGRTRLAVIDGLVSQDAARLLAGALPEGESLVLCGTVLDPAASKVLRDLRPGSKVRKIPASILADYRLARRSPAAAEIEDQDSDMPDASR